MHQISSKDIHGAYLNGARCVIENKKYLNDINVFPVPDGDTGNNLSATMASIIEKSKAEESVRETVKSIADASIYGARGNSGIIFAQYLNGLSMEIDGEDDISIENFAKAQYNSVKYAYDAVSEPVEGTMLTVLKEWAHSLFDFHKKTSDFQELLSHSYEVLENSLKKTKNQLKVLKKAGVVDSGAKGFAIFIKGFMDFLNPIFTKAVKESAGENAIAEDLQDEDIKGFRYCVEAVLDGGESTRASLKEKLKQFGDSLIIAGNEDKTKIHIHTDKPSEVLAEVSKAGEVSDKKVDDMFMQSKINSQKKFSIGLITDTIADLPDQFIKKHQIVAVPLNIMLNGREYLDKVSVDNSMITAQIDTGGEMPTSSQPDVRTVESAMEHMLDHYDSIVGITVAAKLSGTFNVFKMIAGKLDPEGKRISIIDSKQNSGAEGLLVMKCAKMIEAGVAHSQIVERIEEMTGRTKILVSVKNLVTMIRGGRLGTRAGKIAGKLNMKPIVTLDKDGDGTLGGVAFSDKGSKNKIVRQFIKTYNKQGIDSYSVVHVENKIEAEETAALLKEKTGLETMYVMETSSVIAISAGEGAIAVSYISGKEQA